MTKFLHCPILWHTNISRIPLSQHPICKSTHPTQHSFPSPLQGMMANAMVSQDLDPQPIQIFIPSSILPFSVPLSTYFSINPMYTNLAVGGCIFSGQDPMRLLLVQRAATERVSKFWGQSLPSRLLIGVMSHRSEDTSRIERHDMRFPVSF